MCSIKPTFKANLNTKVQYSLFHSHTRVAFRLIFILTKRGVFDSRQRPLACCCRNIGNDRQLLNSYVKVEKQQQLVECPQTYVGKQLISCRLPSYENKIRLGPISILGLCVVVFCQRPLFSEWPLYNLDLVII